MNTVLELQAIKPSSGVEPMSVFSGLSVMICSGWTTFMPMSSASVAVC